MNKSKKNAIIIFCRYPENGKVKTRLANTMGVEFATKFYKLCAEHIFNEIHNLGTNNISKYLFYSDDSDKERMSEWVGSNFLLEKQKGSSLGERMFNAFKNIFEAGSKRVIIIGTDIPDISKETIILAFNELSKSDIVIGPSMDGGYYLLGMNHLFRELFQNINWSTENVFSETIEKIKMKNLKVKNLNPLRDIDTIEDLEFWLNDKNYKNTKFLKKEIQKLFLN